MGKEDSEIWKIIKGIEDDPEVKEAERVREKNREIFANWLKKKDGGGEMPELVKQGDFSERSIDFESEVAVSNQEPERQDLGFLEPREKGNRRLNMERDRKKDEEVDKRNNKNQQREGRREKKKEKPGWVSRN